MKKIKPIEELLPSEEDLYVFSDLNRSDEVVVPLKEFTLFVDEDDATICIKEECEEESCKETYLKSNNYLAEFDTPLAKLLARLNLGIADAYTLTWGNINGNISAQTDLLNYLNDLYSLLQRSIETNLTDIRTELGELINTAIANLQAIETSIWYGGSPLKESTSFRFTTEAYSGNIFVYCKSSNAIISVGGIEGGFERTGNTITRNGSVYYEFKSVNTNLGETEIYVSQ